MLPFGGKLIDAREARRLRHETEHGGGTGENARTITMNASARGSGRAFIRRFPKGCRGSWARLRRAARRSASGWRSSTRYSIVPIEIDADHLLAAFAVWERSLSSATFIFGSALGDPVADEILRELKVAGVERLSRTDISRCSRATRRPSRSESRSTYSVAEIWLNRSRIRRQAEHRRFGGPQVRNKRKMRKKGASFASWGVAASEKRAGFRGVMRNKGLLFA